MSFYQYVMNDSKYIIESPETLNIYGKRKYKELQENIKPDIFISHYPLIMTNSQRRNLNDGSIGSYLCRVDEHIAPICFFGHVHENDVSYKMGNAVYYSNALGYPNERLNTLIKQIYLK